MVRCVCIESIPLLEKGKSCFENLLHKLQYNNIIIMLLCSLGQKRNQLNDFAWLISDSHFQMFR